MWPDSWGRDERTAGAHIIPSSTNKAVGPSSYRSLEKLLGLDKESTTVPENGLPLCSALALEFGLLNLCVFRLVSVTIPRKSLRSIFTLHVCCSGPYKNMTLRGGAAIFPQYFLGIWIYYRKSTANIFYTNRESCGVVPPSPPQGGGVVLCQLVFVGAFHGRSSTLFVYRQWTIYTSAPT